MRFYYSGQTDKDLWCRDGCTCQIVHTLTKEEADIDDIGPMYRVRFKDGAEREVFADELRGTLRFANGR